MSITHIAPDFTGATSLHDEIDMIDDHFDGLINAFERLVAGSRRTVLAEAVLSGAPFLAPFVVFWSLPSGRARMNGIAAGVSLTGIRRIMNTDQENDGVFNALTARVRVAWQAHGELLDTLTALRLAKQACLDTAARRWA